MANSNSTTDRKPTTSPNPSVMSTQKNCLGYLSINTGNTLNSDTNFIKLLCARIPYLKKVSVMKNCDVILVFCPVVSRAGSDIEAALNCIPDASDSKCILVVLHHTFDPDKIVPDSSGCVSRMNTLTVDCLFHEDKGLLECRKNKEALDRVQQWLQPLLKPLLINSNMTSQKPFLERLFSSASTKESSDEEMNKLREEKQLIKPDEYERVKATEYFKTKTKKTQTKLEQHYHMEEQSSQNQSLKTAGNQKIPELRLVLLGRSGSEREAGNIILGRENSQASERTLDGRKVTVVETSDWFCSESCLDKVKQCLIRSSPGPHAFLIVIPVEECTKKEGGMLVKIEDILGKRCWRNTMILFTVTSKKEKENIEISKLGNQEVQSLVKKCGNRFYCLNIKDREDTSQISMLLQMIEEIANNNPEEFFNSEIYLETESQISKISEKIIDRILTEVLNVSKVDSVTQVYMDHLRKPSDQTNEPESKTKDNTDEEKTKMQQSAEIEKDLRRPEEDSLKRNLVKIIQSELKTNILDSNLKMQEKFCRQGQEREKELKRLKQRHALVWEVYLNTVMTFADRDAAIGE